MVSSRHILEQAPVFAALARGVANGVARRFQAETPKALPAGLAPGPWIRRTLLPRSPELIRDYVRNVGGSPSAYRDTVPAHLFPQWIFPLQTEALSVLDYPIHRAVNGGARIEVHGRLPQGVPLTVATRLDSIDDDGRRAILKIVSTTGTPAEPELHIARLDVFIPLSSKPNDGTNKSKPKPRVPLEAREVAEWRLRKDAGLDFAKLTGDFNPIHWVSPYAKMMGFRDVILHGFGSMARAFESIAKVKLAGNVHRMGSLEVRFTRPLVLPARPRLFLDERRFYVGDARGARPYAIGEFDFQSA